VLNVASISAFQPVPSLATYAATKACVLSLTESLAEELQGSGVTVTALCPGITATRMLTSAERASPQLRRLPAVAVGTAAEVAAEGHDACMRGDRRGVIHELLASLPSVERVVQVEGPPRKVASPDAMQNPSSLDFFAADAAAMPGPR
jgi:short-subunit dehydrogenase